MSNEAYTPTGNLYRFTPRSTNGRGRVGVRLTGVGIPDNTAVSPERKEQLINFHISSINALLRAQGRPELSPADHAKVHAAAQLSPNQSSESILQAVLSAATTVAPATNAQDAFKKFLADNQITPEQLNASQQRHGMLSYAALANFAREMRGGTDASGNMSNGVGNTGAGTYPDYGGTPFRSYGAAASYAYSTYGLQGGVTQQLWNLGIRNERQMQQVVTDAKRMGLGDNPRVLNRAAVPTAALRKAEGARTDEHIDVLGQYGRDHESLERARIAAESETDPVKKAELLRQNEIAKRELEERMQQHRNNRVHTPEGKAAFDSLLGIQREEAENHARLGSDAAIQRGNNSAPAPVVPSAQVAAQAKRKIETSDAALDEALLSAAGTTPTRAANSTAPEPPKPGATVVAEATVPPANPNPTAAEPDKTKTKVAEVNPAAAAKLPKPKSVGPSGTG